jgi:hypothetical protein
MAGLGRLAGEIDAALARRQDTRGDRFTMTVGDRRHDKRAGAGQHLATFLQQEITALGSQRQAARRAGELGGFPLAVRVDRALGATTVTLDLEDAPGTSIVISADELAGSDPATLVTRLENRLRRLEERKATVAADTTRARREIEHASSDLGRPFPQTGELATARERVLQIDAELERIAAAAQTPAEAVAAEEAQPGTDGTMRNAPSAGIEREAGA